MSLSNFLKNKPIEPLQAFALLLLRLWVAQEFFFAGLTKLSAGLHAPEWFSGLNFPFPVNLLPTDINWVFAGTTEICLSVLLVIGLFGRLASIGLLFVTWVAVYSVHFDLSWAGWNEIETEQGLGYKVPLMIGLMLCQLLSTGMGQWSLDAWRTPKQPTTTQ
jgi:putative oxidoreductase